MKKIIVIALVLCALGCNDNNTNNQQEICSDNVDNDLDGAIDCADPDCAGSAACLATDCGNGLIDADEECDGTDLNGKSCESLQLGQGTLVCAQCAFDTRGCGNNALKIYQSGTRMKMRVGTSPDESKDFRGWYDAQLAINCTFRKTTNGLIRCLPELTSLNDRWYADSNCTIRHAVFPMEDTDLNQFTTISMEVQTGVFRIYQVTGKVTGEVYTSSQGTCYHWNNPSVDVDVYSVTPIVDESVYNGQIETFE